MPDGPTNQQGEAVALRPHQQDLVNQLVAASSPARFLLACPPGGGKHAALSAAAGAMQAKGCSFRCLVIAPSALADMWREQLRRLAGLDASVMTPQTYRRLQAGTGEGVNVWSTVPCAVASVDFLKSADRMDEALAAKWDLVILEEMHRSTDSTQRGEVAKKIWNAEGVAIAVATTGTPNTPAWIAADPRTTKIHWKLGDLLAHRPLPQRHTHNIFYTSSETERQLAAQVRDLVEQMPKDPASQLTANLLRRRLSSSKYALEQTLRRLLTIETFGDTELNDWSPDDIEEGAVAKTVENSVQIDRQAGEQIIWRLEDEATDSKWECCHELLCSRGIGKTCTGILFTDYAETAGYLEFLAKSRGLNVFLFTGASTADQRERALRESSRAPSLLIASRAIEGADIRFTNQIVHYDIPWNPQTLEQRFGRVERVGSQFNTFDHYFIHEQGGVADTLARLLSKVRLIEEEWK